jgi:tetratricopeptide (TPR) repeat protein
MAGPHPAVDPGTGALEEFAGALRRLRRSAGDPSYRQLARRTGYAATTLCAAASGRSVPTRAVTLAYVAACGGDTVEWESRWRRLADPAVPAAARRPADPAHRPGVVPHQLPFDVYGFIGRSDELSRLDEAIRDPTSAVVISAVSGTAGVGKTALAVHWAHRVADRFPDGQLYVDLRGYAPDQPVSPEDALGGFLRALGVDGATLPPGLPERAAQYRTLLSDRRMLVVLDNAYSVAQVRPLLPGGASCLVLVTSRDDLGGLVAREGARRIDLDLLPPDDGMVLLRTLAGDRVDAEPGAAAELVRFCAGLPLTLRVAAEVAAMRPSASLADLVAELSDEHSRLHLFAVGLDERTAVRAVFSWSYHRLPPPAMRMFRLLGLHPGADLDGYAAAALAGTDLAGAQRLMGVLVRAHLVREDTPGRYGMHDLLRAYAAERAGDDAEPERHVALTRLLHHYLSTAMAAMDLVVPAERARRPRVAPATGPAPVLDTTGHAQDWLDAERANLVAVSGLAADGGWPTQAGYLAATVYRYFYTRAHYQDALTMHSNALRAAGIHGDRYGEATARLGLGAGCHHLGRYDEAIGHYEQALARFRELGGDPVEARALSNLGILYAELGRYQEALDHYRQALARHEEAGNLVGVATTRGWVGLELGRQGHYDEAVEHLERSLAAFREMEFPVREVEMLLDLGQVHLWAGRHDAAFDAIQAALTLAERVEDRFHEADAHNVLAEILYATGQADEALDSFETALTLAGERGQRELQARALSGMAEIFAAAGEDDRAREHWQAVLDIYTALNLPQAEEVRALLAGGRRR